MQKSSARKVVCRVISVIMVCLIIFGQVPISKVQASGDFDPMSIVEVQAADEFDTMRNKWRTMLTGGTSYDTSDPQIAAAISRTTAAAQTYWDSMDKSESRTYLWSDLSSKTKGDMINSAYSQLRSMAIAYCTNGSSLQGNNALLTDIISAIDWMYTKYYNENISQDGNWWYWEIGIPLSLNDITVLLYDKLAETQITNYMNAVNKFAPTPAYTKATNMVMNGTNLIWKCNVIAVRGIIIKDGEKVAMGRDGLSEPLKPVTTGDGFYADGSFVMHNRFAYTGGYGISYMSNISNLMYVLSGSTYEVTDPNKQNVFKWVYDSFEPLIYKGAMMDMVRGRELSRIYRDDRTAGHETMSAIIRLSQIASPEDAAAYKRMIKYWLETDLNGFYTDATVEMADKANAILNDTSITPRGELIKYKQFTGMDRAVQLRPGFGFGISMFSSRIYNFENANNENQSAWHTGDGMTYLYNSDLSQFSDAFWPTVNSYRLPGTTVLQNSQQTGQKINSMDWVGGTDIQGTYGVTGMNLQPYQKNLTAKKSWFMFDDEIVALGSDIDSTDGIPVETVVENRMLNSSGDNALTVDGTSKTTELGWSETMPGTGWIHLAGNTPGSDIGYYFPDKANVEGVREARTGAYSEIDKRAGASTTEYTRNYLNLWLDHSINPSNAGYSYVLLPNKTSSQVGSYAQNPDIEILKNDENVQAVKEKELNIIGANFWNDTSETAGIITSNKKASVMTREETGKNLEVSVSDPTQANPGYINITIDRNAKGILSCDSGITVTQLSPTIKFMVNVNGAHGKAFKVKFDYTGSDETPYEPEIDGDQNTPLFTDDFEDGNTSAWETIGGVWSIKKDNTKTLSVEGASESIATAGTAWTDYTLEGWVKVLTDGGNAGLIVRYVDSSNFYSLCLNANTNQVELYKKLDNTATMVASSGLSVNTDTWYTLRVTANGDNIRGFVNGNPVIDWTNPSGELTAGKIGFQTTSNACFDDVLVTSNNLVDETFNSRETGSTPSDLEVTIDSDVASKNGGVTVEEIPSTSNKSLKLNDTSTNANAGMGSVYVAKSFKPYSGTVTAEFKVMASQVNTILGISLRNPAGTPVATVAFSNNTDGKPNFYTYDGATKKTFQVPTDSGTVNYTADTWYRFKIVANSATFKYDLYMDPGDGKGYRTVFSNYGFRNTSSPYVSSIYMNTTNPLKGVFYIDDLKVTPNDSGIITTSPDTFYKDAQKDVKVYLNLHGNTVSSITNGAYTLTGSDYTIVSGSVYAINASYLATLDSGTATLTFHFSAGNDADSNITIVETAPKNSEIASVSPVNFDRHVPQDVTVNLNLNGNTVTSITNGRYTLLVDSDYTMLSDSEYRINAEYLTTLGSGTASLTFHFSEGNDAEANITVMSSGIVSILPVSVTTTAGTAPVLPETVTGIYENSTTTGAAVQWAAISPSQYAQAGSFEVTGTVEGTTILAIATVTVTNGGTEPEAPTIVSIQPVSVTTTVGTAPVLPAVVTVNLSNSTTTGAAVQWAAINPTQYAQAGSFDVNGTVKGTAIPAIAHVAVNAAPPVNPGNPGNSGNSGSGYVPPVISEPDPVSVEKGTVKVEAKADKDGTVSVSIKADDIKAAINNTSNGTVSVEVKVDEKAREIKVSIPAQPIVASDKQINNIRIDTGLATVNINPDLLKNNNVTKTADLQLTVTRADSSAVPAAVRSVIGNSEVYDFSLKINGTKISTFENKEVSVDAAYTLKPGQDPNKVIVYDISDSGKLEIVKNSWYDAGTGKVHFKPEHFNKYAASYNDVTFSDLSKAAWAGSSIEALAARGIVAGRGDNMFMPGDSITRAEFLVMLLNAFDLTDEKADCTFKDVNDGKWYYNAIATAQKLGIVQGKTDGTFGINDAITRQDMAVMVYKVSELLKVEMKETNSQAQFKDSAKISAYAVNAISAMQKSGIINGVGNDNFAPKNNATRAQAAVIIYQVFNLAK